LEFTIYLQENLWNKILMVGLDSRVVLNTIG